MKTWLAIIALVAVLVAAVPAGAEPGDEPNCPWEYMTPTDVMKLEELREKQIVGGIKGSPYWLWQAYLGNYSLDLRLYDVEEPIFPKQLLFKERVRHAGNSSKTMTLTVRGELERVELRANQAALTALEVAGIDAIIVRNGENKQIAQYQREDIEAVIGYFGLTEEETICLQGEDAPMYMYTADGYRKAITLK